ncbi:hypothetical protein ACMHYB_56630 [Sorangium sp. So ce1128]|uniref:Uncharacterized protein n=1 Tax=Sorangium cellulosum TaxID=56 RepID=A0A3S5GY92_SORCE|nr:hypothetical protein [Sorangium cellulosum]
MMMSKIKGALSGARLTDVLVTGFIDNDERPARFHALWRVVYFEFDNMWLKMAVVGDSGRIRLSLVDEVSNEADLLDDDMLPALSSVRLQVLRDPDGSNVLATLRTWNTNQSPEWIECSAARLDLVNGQQIFVDPLNYFGIQLGGREQEEVWKENAQESWLESVEIV